MKSQINNYIILGCFFFIGQLCANNFTELEFDINNKTTLNYIIDSQVKDQFKFSGLATYLNQVQYYIVESEQIITLNRNHTEKTTLTEDQWFAVTGRSRVLLIQSPNTEISFEEEKLKLYNSNTTPNILILDKTQLTKHATELDQIRYNHLWKPFAYFAKLSESLLVLIKNSTSLSWGISILIFAIIIKLILLPVSLLTSKSQQKVSKINSELQPKLTEIKLKYTGEKAHHLSMKAHKDLGVTPFYTLKPMLSFLIQIPILIAIFNALGDMPHLINQPFLWFSDLSQPDMFTKLGFTVPLFGEYFNLMPIVMTIITLASSVFHKDSHASETENKKQKIKLYFMSITFLIIFYPFPASMVMYWTMANLLGIVQQKLIG